MKNVNSVNHTVPKRKNTLIMPHERTWVQAIIITVIVVCLLFSFLSLFITVLNAFKTDDQVRQNVFAFPNIQLIGEAISTNFSKAWGAIKNYYFSTILVALIGAVGEVIIGSTLAYILTFKDFYYKDFIFMFFISILLVPSIIGYPVLVPLIRDTFKLGDTHFGYLLPMIGGSQVTGMFLFKTFFGQQPKSLYESAQLDGANDIVVFTQITVPLALPIILYYFVGCFSGIYNEYLWASLILDNNMTLTNIMYSVVESNIKYGSMYAMYLIASVPLIITTIISMKYFKSGEFAAGLKL